MSLEQLPKDVLIEIALNLDAPNLINFCKIQKRQNQAICQNEHFWRQKLLKDYPNYESILSGKWKKFRNKYIRMYKFYQSINSWIQDFLYRFYGESQEYMLCHCNNNINKNKYFRDFRNAFVDMYLELKNIDVSPEDYDKYHDTYQDIFRNNLNTRFLKLIPGAFRHILGDWRLQRGILETEYDPHFFLEEMAEQFLKVF